MIRTRNSIHTLTTRVVAAYVANNAVDATSIPSIISLVSDSLSKVGTSAPTPAVAPAAPTPAVPIKRSVNPDYLICLEDGTKLKTLKRYLRARFNMTPDQYRAKWGLPADYPMVAPNYALRRSEIAKSIGLGRSRKAEEPAPEAKPARRGGRRKAA